MNSLSVIILTHNEERHIRRCIGNLQKVARDIYVIDSHSTDNTVALALSLGAKVLVNRWTNHSDQFNWALDHCPLSTDWTMRMDCDEYLTEALIDEVNRTLPLAGPDTEGFILKRRVLFMNKWIRYGGFYPHLLLRIWRTGTARIEERWMDEHVVLTHQERTRTLEADMVDHNLNDLTWWIEKHNHYATREVRDLLAIRHRTSGGRSIPSTLYGEQNSRKRWIKEKLYTRIPLFVRPSLYFLWRYFFRLGFLDGIPGLIWHFLQAFWYRFLVDAKLYELEHKD
jgi:glycosyltransferase involved in cell wall biosynthesis